MHIKSLDQKKSSISFQKLDAELDKAIKFENTWKVNQVYFNPNGKIIGQPKISS